MRPGHGLRFNETPRIDVALVKSLEAPGGIGEPGTSCVMPALTNAIFAATGTRIRKLPVGSNRSLPGWRMFRLPIRENFGAR